jgi:NAD(P)-dependent dehydrogenase (short-subunit alcohol dehydrogenase family)
MITGANRGIGLEFVRQYAAVGWKVIATCRNPIGVGDLAKVEGNIEVHGLDVTDQYSIARLAKDLDGMAIDLLLNSAGVFGPRNYTFNDLEYSEWMKVFDTNIFSPLKICSAFLPHVLKSDQKKMVTVSSIMGSIGQNTGGGNYIYKSSKAAVNQVMRCLANDLLVKKVAIRLLHPGWVKTDMGGEGADITAEVSVSGMRSVIDDLNIQSTGTFNNYDGTIIPW